AKCDAYFGRKFSQPAWDGSPLGGRTLLVLCDQSLGDTIQFVRYLHWLREWGQGTVLFAAQRVLHPLLKESGFEDVVSLDAVSLAFDVHTSIMLLPALYYAAHKTIDAPVPYLLASGGLVERWRERIAALDGFKVGICWQGNPYYPWDEFRSIPLAEFAPLGQVPGVCLIGLQHGAGREQLEQIDGRFGVIGALGHLGLCLVHDLFLERDPLLQIDGPVHRARRTRADDVYVLPGYQRDEEDDKPQARVVVLQCHALTTMLADADIAHQVRLAPVHAADPIDRARHCLAPYLAADARVPMDRPR
ncbi:hypothetical protein LCGC14_2712030, partial [marine sediment metagenome]